MLALIFHVGIDRYAIDSRDVVEVLPLVDLHRTGRSPDWLAGLFTYRGAVTPVLDLGRLPGSSGGSSAHRLSSRIILVRYPVGFTTHWLGLRAERIRVEHDVSYATAADSLPGLGGAAAVGPVVTDAEGLLQVVEIGRLLPPALRDQLFADPSPAVVAETD